jgi:gamma-glutamyl hydrolase
MEFCSPWVQASLYAKLPDSKYNLALENHMYGMPPVMYEKYPILSEWYTIVSTSKDRNGTVYVSSMEGKKFPFFGEPTLILHRASLSHGFHPDLI